MLATACGFMAARGVTAVGAGVSGTGVVTDMAKLVSGASLNPTLPIYASSVKYMNSGSREAKTPPKTPLDLPKVAIVGRPNVGKSTLLNRIVGRRVAIVEEQPGVTRDRKDEIVEWMGRSFILTDTGGWLHRGSEIDHKVSQQSELAVAQADLLLFVVDATLGVTDQDSQMADFLHRQNKPTLLVANKVDTERQKSLIWEFVQLGFGDPRPLSALHGVGTADILDEIIWRLAEADQAALPEDATEDASQDASPNTPPPNAHPHAPHDALVSVAIVGRPNVGKSTLFNKLAGDDRSVVHDQPGTTRDTIDTVVETELGRIKFIDTAGLRRKARIDENTEHYAALRALRAIDKADIVLFMIDATAGLTHQDMRLAERVDRSGCPILVLLNKWELLSVEQRKDILADVEHRLGFVGDGSVIRMTALTGKGVHRILPALSGAVADYRKRVPTRLINKVVRLAQAAHPAPGGARVLYATQGATDPPTFILFANRKLPQTYIRYLERKLREELSFGATPLRLRVRLRSE